ncbi:MAG: hypothetical protein DWP97_06965 [Calditrichaeota bacterium]|nr:MAG: hypothetical protein DWP97_06965 [Calditrichota bacterium]
MPAKSTIIYICCIVLVVIVGAVFWFSNLDVDPVMNYSGIGQSLSTDPHHYVYHARNKILFGSFNPYDDPRWTVFQHSIVSLVSYFVFSLTSVSLVSANTVGVILSLLGLLFFILALWKDHSPLIILIFTMLYLLNSSLIVHARVPYLENGLLFYTGLLFFLYTYWSTKIWNLVLSGVVIALAAFTGKLFGIFLFPVTAAAIFFSNEDKRGKAIGVLSISAILSSILLIFILYGSAYQNAFGYMTDQTYSLRGMPKILSMPYNLFEYLISYGLYNRFFFINIDFVLFILIAGYIYTAEITSGRRFSQFPKSTVFSILMIGMYYLVFMAINYSPIRYAIVMIPMILIASLSIIKSQVKAIKKSKSDHSWKNYILLTLILWFALFHILVRIFFINQAPATLLTYTTLPGALLLAYLLRVSLMKQKSELSAKVKTRLLIVVVIFSVLINGDMIYSKLTEQQNYNIVEANNEIAKIIGNGAVISGGYAPLLTINNNHKTFIHQFGLRDDVAKLFHDNPVTHLVIETSILTQIQQQYPRFRQMIPVTSLWVRNVEVKVYNIFNLFGNQEALRYVPTVYEHAAYYYFSNNSDSALFYIDKFHEQNSMTKSSGLILADALFRTKQYKESVAAILDLAGKYPTDFFVQMHCGQIVQAAGLLQNDAGLTSLAMKYYEKATLDNPYRANDALTLYRQTINEFGPNKKP